MIFDSYNKLSQKKLSNATSHASYMRITATAATDLFRIALKILKNKKSLKNQQKTRQQGIHKVTACRNNKR